MKSFQVTRSIAAPPTAVWRILIDARRLADGAFGILRIDGDISAGATFKLWSEVSPKRAFTLTVSAFEPEKGMIWESGMPFGLLRGRRRFALSPTPGGTEFSMREDYSGPLVGLIGRSIPDLTPSFEKFADGLAAAAGGGST